MKVEFWGVRGSCPAPGREYDSYGGHTTCVNVIFEDNVQLILDAGLGIKKLGEKLLHHPLETIRILSTHFHWDHIQGLPFFPQIYMQNQRVEFYSAFEKHSRSNLTDQMNGIQFPVKFSDLPSNIENLSIHDLESQFSDDMKIDKILTNHPGHCYAYKINYKNKTLVFCPDNELNSPIKSHKTIDQFASFFDGADLLIHDMQYRDEEMEQKKGWGHSSISMLSQLLDVTNVKTCVAFHHDPIRSDKELDEMETQLKKNVSKTQHVMLAKEKSIIDL